MSRSTLACVGFSATLFLGAGTARPATVTGRVLDSGGAPVAGVRISWEAYRTDEQTLVDETKGVAPESLGETTTDAAGVFRVKLDKPGVDVSIRVAPGTLPGALLAGPYGSSEDVALDDIELPAAEKISGRVSDEAGKLVADARIRATGGFPFEEEDVVFYAEAKSGAGGSYSISNAPANGGGLSVRAAGYSPTRQQSLQRRTTLNATLKRGGMIRGIVRDVGGKPAEGATVIVGSLAAKTDASGAYEIGGVPTGTQQVEAFWKEDLAARRDAIHVKNGETVDVPLRLAKAASLTGSVIDERTRRPLSGVRVSASSSSFFSLGDVRGRRVRTDARGRFRIAGLAPRAHTVRASKTDYLPAVMPGIVAGTSTPGTVAIALQRAAAVSGRVSDESGAPVAGARVRFSRDSNIRALVRGGPAAFFSRPVVTTGTDGAFRMRGLAAQRNLTLEAAKAGYVSATRPGVTLKAGETARDLALILKRGLEARGRVVDVAGQPIAGAEIRVTPVERGGSPFVAQFDGVNREKPDAASGADGSFRLAGLEAGEYALAVSRDGYAPKRVPSATVVEKGPNEWHPIVLGAGVPIAGVVRSSKGDRIVGAEVFAFGDGTARNSRTDLEGRFRLDGYGADRRVMINVRAEGYAALQRSVTPSADEVVLVLSTSGTIRGRVEDGATNRPITDFTASYGDGRGRLIGGIRVVLGIRDPDRAFQSPDGTFELSDVPPGKWSVRASAPGYRPADVSGVDLGEGETKEGIVVSLEKGGVVTGRVLDPRRGAGVPNASVSWSEGSDASGSSPGMMLLSGLDAGGGRAVTTDTDGRFRFDGLPAGKITLSAEHPDFLDVSKQVDLDEEATVELTLALGGSISGTVVGKDGRSGIPGAEVFLRDQGAAYSIGDDSARADAGGNFSFEHLRAGRYGVSARSNAGATAWKDLVLGENQRQEGVLLEIAPGATVLGTVSGLAGRSLGGVRVSAYTEKYQDSAVTGDDGRFTLRDVPAGVLSLHASTAFPTMRSTSKNLDVPEGATEVPVEIVFEGTSRLAGRVTRGDEPVSSAWVSAVPDPATPAGSRGSGQTDEDGRYSLEGLVDGDYLVRVSGQSASYSRRFTVSGDTNGDMALPTLTISGLVTDAGSNEPIEGASIQAESGAEAGPYSIKRATTDSRGFYSLDGVDSGNYQITARKEGYQLKTLPLSVAAAPAELNVSLARGAGLSIRAVDGLTGIPLRSLTVLAYTGSGSLAFTGNVGLDGEGKGEISSLGPGGYGLYIFSEGYASRSYRVTVPSPMVAIAMTPGGRVEVRTDAPFSGRIVDAAGTPYMIFPGRLDAPVAGAPPAVSWGGLAPGSYRLLVSSESGENAYPFTVVEGQTTTIQVR